MTASLTATAPGDVLIVDDAKPNLELLSELLKQVGHRVRPVSSGRMALEAVDFQPPDIILLDINMPEMSGYEVCRQLKEKPSTADIPVLFISALSETRDKLRAFEVGCVDFITKPFRLEEVRARVDTHLRMHRLHAELESQHHALAEAHERVVGMQEMRDNLISMIVHDLRSPLTGIVSSLRFMEEDARDNDGMIEAQDLQQALRSSRRLMNMINQLLDINRMEADEMPITLSSCTPEEIMADAFEMLGADKVSRISWDTADVQPTLRCDRELVGRVVVNLIDNALKVSPSMALVHVAWVIDEESWTIRVEDQGPGVPVEYKERIFEKFGQLEARTQSKLPSTGLGLTFCRLVAQVHQGGVAVEDREGGGSVFTFSVPINLNPVQVTSAVAS